MPKEKYDPPDPRRIYTIMSAEEVANGKKSHWAELEISGRVRSLSTSLWSLTHLTALHLNDNYLSRIPPDIAKLHNLVYLDLSSNKLRSLPAELGNMVSLRELLLNNNLLRVLPYELGRLFQLQTLGLKDFNIYWGYTNQECSGKHKAHVSSGSNMTAELDYGKGISICWWQLCIVWFWNHVSSLLPSFGNPLSQDILNLYQDPDGTRKLLNFMLDNLADGASRSSHMCVLCLTPVLWTDQAYCYQSVSSRAASSEAMDYIKRTRPNSAISFPNGIFPDEYWVIYEKMTSFTVMCYNVLCDKYATRQLYGYCPSWALNWEYRKKGIMEEIVNCDADIISLQVNLNTREDLTNGRDPVFKAKEVETEQYFTLFLPALKERGYDGFFSPKSRAKIMSEQERKHVDGCAIFFKTENFAEVTELTKITMEETALDVEKSGFTLVQKHTVEFNQVAMANSDGSEAMLNRVMTKDNIGVAVVLEVHKELFGAGKEDSLEDLATGMKPIHAADKQLLIVANAHMHWDPEYSDVKLIQTMMFVSEVKNILEKASSRPGSPTADPNSIPLVLCADLNSLPDSGVVEYLSNGGVADNHKDFKELRYNECLMNFSCNGKNGSSEGRITHGFQLKSAYENNLMPYTNYTFDFKVKRNGNSGVIDYIFYSKTHMNVLGVLGPLDPQWLVENNITGCPHPHIPSDHFSLLTQLELHPPLLPLVNGVHLPNRR
ncbi:CCR4-NOT transcription complex subunit 6-like [Saguinus oedipus]|uniref:poly(A)-specific ribonuclease n=1 Tax=Saguinus oedipus TaxID=9490 RepID=A0ABQ9W479_SAGOE|nr:CCR4-NOT transcription complex subunit 6-like [Saguinus oedipus]